MFSFVIFVSILSGGLLCLFIVFVWQQVAASMGLVVSGLQLYPEFSPAARYLLSGCILFFAVYFFAHIRYTPCDGYFIKNGVRVFGRKTAVGVGCVTLIGAALILALKIF
jgi:hypothetical protein